MIFRYKAKFISDIEQKIRKLLVNIAVAPFVGVWIEISEQMQRAKKVTVAPFVGVWIEINKTFIGSSTLKVAPFVGVWIEICFPRSSLSSGMSLPSWECGLKFLIYFYYITLKSRSLRGSVD